MDAKGLYYLIDDREVTSFTRSGCTQELSTERQNVETLISLTHIQFRNCHVSWETCCRLLA